MIFYTLDSSFQKSGVIDRFTSGIWTERYSTPGDFQLVLNASDSSTLDLSPDSLISMPGSQEVMIVDTQSIQDELITVSGSSLLSFFQNRFFRLSAYEWSGGAIFSYVRPSTVITDIVGAMNIPGYNTAFGPISDSDLAAYGVDPTLRISNLSILNLVTNESVVPSIQVSNGPILDLITSIAQAYNLGIKLILNSAADGGYSLQFIVYNGMDHTLGSGNNIVRFSPNLDNFGSVSEVYSNANKKTVVYVFPAPANISADFQIAGASYTPVASNIRGVAQSLEGPGSQFGMRVLYVEDSNFNTDDFDQTSVATFEAAAKAYLNALAQQALLEATSTEMIDGTILPSSQYRYGAQFGLGDRVEIQGSDSSVATAQITEFIRSQDSSGEKQYPTLAGVS